ncbi:hsp90-like protein [Colletotrichum navitas]|uniref:histidine kinase n=1 Tax=Colletotrichum navitas TaxID=681940 RepID=A0AAD8Q514_9PEZI|nr:hsp90-like protein [Colletotrichum navitas]KAK1595981.1 hsp90-like protein [Colletotrichum navitas]
MMDGAAIGSDDHFDPPSRLFERLRQIAGYTWDESRLPFHTSYDIWHLCGTRFVSPYQPSSSTHHASSPGSTARLQSGRPSPSEHASSSSLHSGIPSDASSDFSATSPPPPIPSGAAEISYIEEPVVARVSYHVLREERAFHIAKNLFATADPNGHHIVKPLDLVRLAPHSGDRGSIVVAIYQHPGQNYLFDLMDMGPAFYKARKVDERYEAYRKASFRLKPPIDLQYFLDFAIGASQCLEILHYGQAMTHGEIRPDAFHFNIETNSVKLINFGTGTRSFEGGLSSTSWSSLSKELGAKNKLLYISPEQTGRMPAEPDSRTDIYSLGVVLWTLLTQQPVFEGETPLDIVQGVLGRRIPNVSQVRLDIPDVIGRIIQKCTAKTVADRYHSASGLKHDLLKVQQFLTDGDWLALKEWKIGEKDISSFFILPSMMIGRQKERAEVIRVIERVAKSHSMNQKSTNNRFSDGSQLSVELPDCGDLSSEGASSAEGTTRRSGSFTHTTSSDPRQSKASFVPSVLSDTQTISADTIASSNSGPFGRMTRPWDRQWERHHSVSIETRSLADGISTPTDSNRLSAVESTSSSLSRQLGSAKFRRRGHCEIVLVEGAGGLGKSCLYQSVLAEARRRGYCATAKFDTARRTAFGPLLKLLSSLFKQVFGERNTDTQFHQALKHYVRPVWPTLHKVLGLPDFLLGALDSPVPRSVSITQSVAQTRSIRAGLKRRGSSPGSSPGRLTKPNVISSQASQDFLRAGGTTKTMRLMNTFLDVLRMFTSHKFICFVLDDLHFADDESMELISQIIGARMKMVVIITYRPEELSPERVQSIIHPPESEEFPRSGGPVATRIKLTPLGEDDIIQYVATTLCRPKEEVLPLAIVIQSKTAGNPFYMREMLSACYRKRCIWYDYRDSNWHFDLDRLFEHFKGASDYDILDTGFITRRLNELPPASRAILAWAALLGSSFSFELISRLLSGEFQYEDEGEDEASCRGPGNEQYHASYTQQEAINGLQAAVQAYIIIPSETDDRFRFAHDRFIQASAALKECNARKMHFVIAQTLLKYYSADPKAKDNTASHICESVDIIKKRVFKRRPYRKLLFECAQAAVENCARPTASKLYSTAVALLQPDPWNDELEDVSYDETMQLHLRAAECYLYMGNHVAANALLDTIFECARSPLDKAPAYVLQSRTLAQCGDAKGALESLKECLHALDVQFDDNPTFENCDDQFEKMSVKIQTMDKNELLNPPQSLDPALPSVGAVLAETVSAAWWSDYLRFYHLSLVMLDLHLTHGAFPQSGMAFLHLGLIALARFNMVTFAVEVGNVCIELLDRYRDPFSMARGYMLYANFIGHVQVPVAVALSHLEGSVDYAAAAGDRISSILSFGLAAQLKFFASENCSDLEAFCQYGCEEIPNWHRDTRGGTLLISIRQACRALQGKTRTTEPLEVMTDEQHNSANYKSWLEANTQNGNRSILWYESIEIVPLFIYGHYDRAIEIGQACFETIQNLWSARNSRLVMFFYGLALAGSMLRKLNDPRLDPNSLTNETDTTLHKLRELTKRIKEWEVYTEVNYMSWSKILEAQIAELTEDYGGAIKLYEEALDNAEEHNYLFEAAVGNTLMAGTLVRRKARRLARSAFRDAIAFYRQFGAVAVAERLEEEHAVLLHSPARNPRTTNAAVQTDFAGDSGTVGYRVVEGEEGPEGLQQSNHTAIADIKGERIGAWRGSMHEHNELGAGLPALDMIDLHAILLSSQVISGVLRVDELLKTMCDVILQTCGGSATLAAIVVQDSDESGWCLAASGDPERGASAHIPGVPLAGTSLVAENVILYCTRFREAVFIPDIISDERFGNVSEAWLQRNVLSKAIIAIPICHGSKPLLGVLYLEGEPGSFTDRNVSVLQLLVNQIGISYSNALAMKAVEKVSAENVSMVALQKRALAKALEAETKAKHAEAEAKRNVKLAEEAAKAKSIFLANVSHELRTPLNGVIGNSELLKDSELDKDQQEMADNIKVSAELLLTVINDILDFSRMEADKMKLYVIAFNPEEMVREVVRAVSYSNRQKTKQKNVKIIQDIDLPSMLIFGDPIRLHQVLGNLISNSLKFTEDGSITIGARVESETNDKATLLFRVQDTGIGIPQQQLAKLFQPFSQADTSTARKYGGSGLGLSICKSLIETMMKGKIQLDSQEGVGTTAWFKVTFDKAKSDVSAGDAQQMKSPPAVERSAYLAERDSSPNPFLDLTAISKDQIRICIAEDNPINQKIAIQYAQRLGYTTVDAYENGLKAVEGLRQKAREGRPYHVVLMDVQMPVLDGYEATKMIRKDPIDVVRKILVIAMTASAIQGDREKCLAAGMNDYLAKPVRSEVLKKKLDTYISPQVSTASSSDAVRSSSALPAYATTDLNGAGASFHLPIRENPAYSRPSGSTAAPSQISSDTRSTTDTSLVAETQSQAPSQKRALRKLTKTRTSTESLPAEKPRAVLTKKAPQRQGTTSSMDENLKPEIMSYHANSRNSTSSQGSSGKDKIIPG